MPAGYSVAICDDCISNYSAGPRVIASTLPFAITFVLITIVAYRKVFPLLSSNETIPNASKGYGPSGNPEIPSQSLVRRIAALTFSSTIAFSAVLTELLLCEISNSFNPGGRSLALRITIVSLLGLLIVAIPVLGIHTVVVRSGHKAIGHGQTQRRIEWALQFAVYAIFLLGFWAIGALLPPSKASAVPTKGSKLFQACLDRLAITGVTLMAMLSGFASVSAISHTFGPQSKPVAENDVQRRQAGLVATLDMIVEKKSRLQNLEKRTSEAPKQGLWSKAVGTFRGDKVSQEKQTLAMEISGLTTMSHSLEASLGVLQSRRADQLKSTTSWGRMLLTFSFIFACYCVYRICTTTVSVLRGLFMNGSGSAATDPVTYAIALFARHIYPSIDQESWAQQISFLLSGVMLLASFSAVTQTFHLFSKFLPSILHATRTNFALLVSQISGMYVISSALMLRGMMPETVGGVINSAMGAGLLEPAYVQNWFNAFFMFAVLITTIGIFLGKQMSGSGAWDEDNGWDKDIEVGKQS